MNTEFKFQITWKISIGAITNKQEMKEDDLNIFECNDRYGRV